MTDYEGWTETEISREDFYDTQQMTEGPHLRRVETYTGGARKEWSYYRLDPPAPKYREGEMRWLTDQDGYSFLVERMAGGWGLAGEGDRRSPAWLDEPDRYTLSDPVVVVPAPTDEEREHFLSIYGPGVKPPMAGIFGHWMARIAETFRGESA